MTEDRQSRLAHIRNLHRDHALPCTHEERGLLLGEIDRLARGDALAKAVQLIANQLAAAGLHIHAQELCFAIDEFEESAP